MGGWLLHVTLAQIWSVQNMEKKLASTAMEAGFWNSATNLCCSAWLISVAERSS
eukprot:CAMPEP_0202891672 /NCGR_PEP_ID=MMETSP1392-20130828/1678_1 /ASSEMBLY_ACC=CAM_ASM_000868 /TAXON_ID=225041 /ORGANISM="Chlamydomonas chlamydogama, Strain SAG 11-48b" /LENGTH=53 /DNA_ID=CAMNT_0049575497 /DNA_START=108 /DNA_END=269 /DNA_ORIENTATION=-